MTTFWREGFHRTNMHGNTHWVEGHWVDRDDWARYGNGDSSTEYFDSPLERARVRNSRTARFINPNADCPVCGAPVFFYQNESGSRVYFDELGPPWPKHPCTDTATDSSAQELEGVSGDWEPRARNRDDIATIQNWISEAAIDPEFDPEFLFEWRYGKKPWKVSKIGKRIRGVAGVFLILKGLESSPFKTQFMYCKTLPKCLREGSVVMTKKDALSFLDLASMEPREVPARRIRCASAFVEELASD